MSRVRHGQPRAKLEREEFEARFRERFSDPTFQSLDLEPLVQIAWRNYDDGRKAPRTQAAGAAYADSRYQLSKDWLAARAAIKKAEREHKTGPKRFLVVSGSGRNEHTCPGEQSKSHRIAELVRETLSASGETELLDLSRTTAELGRNIYPCKSCVSTAMPLCHWPCSCYPNHALGQTNDWMNEIYPMWVRAHGVIVITPVNWYQAPGPLKTMMDRMVCADGGNPDPTSTHGKRAEEARKIELKGWHFPQHLAGRVFGVIVHGDAEGVDALKMTMAQWLRDLGMVDAGHQSILGRYLGYYEPYPLGHATLDKDKAFQDECRTVAKAVAHKVLTGADGSLPRTRAK